MSETFFQPTEPTTDSLNSIPLVGSTSSRADTWLLEFSRLTPLGNFYFKAERPRADHPPLSKVQGASADRFPQRTEYIWIDDLGEAGYRILQPISVEIKAVGIGDYEAWFRQANIAMSGSDSSDAFQGLVAEILDTFDLLLREKSLGPDAVEQLQILRTYIAKT